MDGMTTPRPPALAAAPVLVLAGIHDSGPEHWQSRWLQAHPGWQKLQHTDWHQPDCHRWCEELEAAVAQMEPGVTLVAHSLACLMVAHWAQSTRQQPHAALLVSVPDPDGPAFPAEARHFGPLPGSPLPFRSLIVASRNDPYGTSTHMQRCAQAWGSQLVEVGELGHINTSSPIGDWPQGLALLHTLQPGLRARPAPARSA